MRARLRTAGLWMLTAAYGLLWTGGHGWHALPGCCDHATGGSAHCAAHNHCAAGNGHGPAQTAHSRAGQCCSNRRHAADAPAQDSVPAAPQGHHGDCLVCQWFQQACTAPPLLGLIAAGFVSEPVVHGGPLQALRRPGLPQSRGPPTV